MHPSSGAPSSRRPEFPFVAQSDAMKQWLMNTAEIVKHSFAVALVAKACSLELPALCKEIGIRVTHRGRRNGILPHEFRFLNGPVTMGLLHHLSENEGARAIVFQNGEKIDPAIQEDHIRLMQQFNLVICIIPSDPITLVQSNAWSMEFARVGTRTVTFQAWHRRPEEDRSKIIDLLTARMPTVSLDDQARSLLMGQVCDGVDDIKQTLTEAYGRMKRSQQEDAPRIITAAHISSPKATVHRQQSKRPSSTNPSAA
jgi:hypothetical protein